ncbi:hypothetical protein JCM17380_13320 [Desulfosporosinus burensis]
MSNNEFTVLPLILKISNKDISNIMEKALDQGSCLHWCYNIESMYQSEMGSVSSIISNGGTLLFYGMEQVYQLTKSKLMLGIQQALPYLTQFIKGDTLEVSSMSSDDADFIIQMALWNEVLFD